MPNRHRGRVNSWDHKEGFGFIRQEKGRDVFVNRSQIISGERRLERGDEVEFSVRLLPRAPEAVDVIRL